MTMQILQSFFMWCSLINILLLFAMFAIIVLAKERIYRMHSQWFDISRKDFDVVLYCFLGFYKLIVFVFCIIPWIVLTIIR
jgi:hypothetical protein